MAAVLILSSLALGTYLAWATARELARSSTLDRWRGALLVIGFVTIGMALSLSR